MRGWDGKLTRLEHKVLIKLLAGETFRVGADRSGRYYRYYLASLNSDEPHKEITKYVRRLQRRQLVTAKRAALTAAGFYMIENPKIRETEDTDLT
jgi:hypothetical protein